MSEPVVFSVHRLRRVARLREREIQAALDAGRVGSLLHESDRKLLMEHPEVRGVRVVPAGLFQHAVLGTEGRGH